MSAGRAADRKRVRASSAQARAVWKGVVEPGHEEVNKARAGVKPRSCRFIVEGEAKHFRGSGLVVVDGVGSISALPAE